MYVLCDTAQRVCGGQRTVCRVSSLFLPGIELGPSGKAKLADSKMVKNSPTQNSRAALQSRWWLSGTSSTLRKFQ